jgi:polar amino acid transport system substrate-binding protein
MQRTCIACIAIAFALFAALQSARADLQQILAQGVIHIGTQLDSPPFGLIDANGKPTGMDVELGEMIAKALGVKYDLVQDTGANRIPYLLTKKVDILISAIGVTPQRATQIMYTAPYADAYIGVFGPTKFKVTDPSQLGSLTIACTQGTTQDIWLSHLAPQAHIVRFQDDATSGTAFMSGQTDLIATLNTVADAFAKREPSLGIGLKFKLRDSPAHIALRQGDFALLQWLNTYLFYIKVDGELQQLGLKWLGKSQAANLQGLPPF